jgi:hypothetical protein
MRTLESNVRISCKKGSRKGPFETQRPKRPHIQYCNSQLAFTANSQQSRHGRDIQSGQRLEHDAQRKMSCGTHIFPFGERRISTATMYIPAKKESNSYPYHLSNEGMNNEEDICISSTSTMSHAIVMVEIP